MTTPLELSDSAARDPELRESYRWFLPLTTRWMDNDIYGHINNVIYYAYFDTIANTYLIHECGLDIHRGDEIGYIVHSQCHYKSGLAYPDRLEGGLRVNRIGNSSVEYGIAVFKMGTTIAAAHGTFTHVFVDRTSERPRPLSPHLREGLTRLLASHFDG
ncbi:MAG: thioesterase family protein [Spongiibacteraceae bacterium]